ncbi:hypothetical protein VP01_1454g5 [Puccinia sorghi]|uniref:Uncharacterized protein n=1 Tax=Puccinia sorghi TaxID=27349 RepID=A0A0L6VLU1_9BASI|nr:hypothetical protein VP01_1454g5 [Puccinia sorghi]
MAVQKRKLTRLERRAQPMPDVIPHDEPLEHQEASKMPVVASTKLSNQEPSRTTTTTTSMARKPKSLTNKQKLKIQRGLEISDKLKNKASKKIARNLNRLTAKTIYD